VHSSRALQNRSLTPASGALPAGSLRSTPWAHAARPGFAPLLRARAYVLAVRKQWQVRARAVGADLRLKDRERGDAGVANVSIAEQSCCSMIGIRREAPGGQV
jgi:hypothetical protein